MRSLLENQQLQVNSGFISHSFSAIEVAVTTYVLCIVELTIKLLINDLFVLLGSLKAYDRISINRY